MCYLCIVITLLRSLVKMLENDECIDDDYHHVSNEVIYTAVNIPGPGADLQDFEVQFTEGCECKDGCSAENGCPCIEKYGMNYDESGRLLESKCSGPVVECNSLCGCSGARMCMNRLVQFGPRSDLQIFNVSAAKGLGLKSAREIEKGEFICEYAGEVIGLEEARSRSQANADKMNYILVLKEHLSGGQILKTCVDPSMIGNIGRYINHSCQPNSIIVPVRVENPVPKLCIFASRIIEANEEITFDYGGGTSVESESCEKKPCCCGAPVCKGFLPFDETLF